MKRIGLFLALMCMACGSSQTQSEEPTPVVEGEPAEAESAAQPAESGAPAGQQHHHHDFPEAVTAFHDVLAPLWHAEEGETRTEDTCNAIASLRERAQAITAAATPAEAADREAEWQAAAQGLVDSVGVLEQACGADGRPEFASRFTELHDAFHALIALIGHRG